MDMGKRTNEKFPHMLLWSPLPTENQIRHHWHREGAVLTCHRGTAGPTAEQDRFRERHKAALRKWTKDRSLTHLWQNVLYGTGISDGWSTAVFYQIPYVIGNM